MECRDEEGMRYRSAMRDLMLDRVGNVSLKLIFYNLSASEIWPLVGGAFIKEAGLLYCLQPL
jgi:hypothetical protein